MRNEGTFDIFHYSFQINAVANDDDLFGLGKIGMVHHLVADVLADRDAKRAVHIEAPACEMRVLAAMKGGKEGGFCPAAGPIGDPAGSSRVGVHQVDGFLKKDPPQGQNVGEAPSQTAVVDGQVDEFRGRRLAETARGDENPVALLGLFPNQGRRGGFRAG